MVGSAWAPDKGDSPVGTDLSICILTHNQPVILPRCVAACVAEIERLRLTAEIIIADNASNDEYPQRLVHSSPMIRIIRNEQNLSFSAANNKTIRGSKGERVLILNDDAILQEGSLGLMVRELDSRQDIGAVGPKLLNPDGSVQQHFTNRRFPHLLNCLALVSSLEVRLERHAWARRIFSLDRDLERSSEAEHLAAACLLLRRRALEVAGLFDEGFYYWFEDTDLCYRLKKAGWKIRYMAEAQVSHYQSASIGRIAEREREILFFQSQMYYLRKYWSGPKYFFVRVASAFLVFLGTILVLIGVRARSLSRKDRNAWAKAYLPIVRFLLWEWNEKPGSGLIEASGQIEGEETAVKSGNE